MRIQHNILAMNAYRNYNANTSALGKNLEKLSSGYKINRAGDDAAGLAISEKMRAQITGLSAAQKNVKDGISLVKTAEGAMQEIHDMLNRMDYLATQSANGTYQDPVDRENLQKEVDALRTEINRIADSSNFNGINLLDGSLENGKDLSTTAAGKLPEVGIELGTNTVLHRDPDATTGGTSFSIDLHNVAVKSGDTLKLTLGKGTANETVLEYKAGADQSGSVLTNAIVDGLITTASAGTASETVVNGSPVANNKEIQINGQVFTVEVDTSSGDDRIVFTQKNAPTQASEEVDPFATFEVSGASTTQPSAAVVDVWEMAAPTVTPNAGDTLTIGSTAYTIVAAATGAANEILAASMNAAKLGELIATEYNKDPNAEYTAVADNTGKITFTAKKAGAVAGEGPAAAVTLPTVGANNGGGTTGTYTAGALTNTTPGADVGAGTDQIVTGIADYNVSTTDPHKVTAAGASRLASTHFKLSSDMVADGAKIRIGGTEYTFGEDVKIDDLDSKSSSYLTDVAKRLADAAGTNRTYTVGHDGTRLTFTEIEGQDDYDLTTLEGVEKSFGFTPAKAVSTGLTLQIGDTSEDFNQLNVSIGDMHVDAMAYTNDDGETVTIGDIDISNQKGAQDAIAVIKNAINYVSSIRGDLGATQNRLEHTANNLSVMSENIQDAESTIRDTDVAEEMMAYTKNNILVQAAQAMLAQANAVPQGVLQLLQ